MAEPFLIQCTACKAKMRTSKREVIGRKIKCPKCEAAFVAQPLKTRASSSASSKCTKSPDASSKPVARAAKRPVEAEASLVSWKQGSGDDTKYHIAHVSAEGVVLALKVKDHETWVEVTTGAKSSPDDAAEMLQEVPKSVRFAPDEIVKVTYADGLRQFTLFAQDGRKTSVPKGDGQADIFAAVKQHFDGTESEEEADAWSVMKGPLVTLAIFGAIGGFAIWFTTMCEPGYEATGRRAGMKTMLNWLGYTIGPMWMSVGVGSLLALILILMTIQLIKRPVRQVFQLSN